MDLGISGRVALVFGASGGLGGGIARALAREGVVVALAGRNAAALEAVRADIVAAGGRAEAIVWDLADLSAIEANASAVEALVGPVDILVNNTGGPPPTTAGGQDLDVWRRHFEAMVLSVIGVTDRFLPGMRARKWGRVLTSTTSGVIAPIPNLGLSNALRSSLVGWSKTLAREVAADGVTVNMLVPGRIETDRVRRLDAARAAQSGKPIEQVVAEGAALIPVGRNGTPEEFGAVAAFLASAGASYVTGSQIRVDGGLIASV